MRVLLFLVLTLTLTGCATNAVTGKSRFNFMSTADQIAMGEKTTGPISNNKAAAMRWTHASTTM